MWTNKIHSLEVNYVHVLSQVFTKEFILFHWDIQFCYHFKSALVIPSESLYKYYILANMQNNWLNMYLLISAVCLKGSFNLHSKTSTEYNST